MVTASDYASAGAMSSVKSSTDLLPVVSTLSIACRLFYRVYAKLERLFFLLVVTVNLFLDLLLQLTTKFCLEM